MRFQLLVSVLREERAEREEPCDINRFDDMMHLKLYDDVYDVGLDVVRRSSISSTGGKWKDLPPASYGYDKTRNASQTTLRDPDRSYLTFSMILQIPDIMFIACNICAFVSFLADTVHQML